MRKLLLLLLTLLSFNHSFGHSIIRSSISTYFEYEKSMTNSSSFIDKSYTIKTKYIYVKNIESGKYGMEKINYTTYMGDSLIYVTREQSERTNINIIYQPKNTVKINDKIYKQALVEGISNNQLLFLQGDEVVIISSSKSVKILSTKKLNTKKIELFSKKATLYLNSLLIEYSEILEQKKLIEEEARRKAQNITYEINPKYVFSVENDGFSQEKKEETGYGIAIQNDSLKVFSENQNVYNFYAEILEKKKDRVKIDDKYFNVLYVKTREGAEAICAYNDKAIILSSSTTSLIHLTDTTYLTNNYICSSRCAVIYERWYNSRAVKKAEEERKRAEIIAARRAEEERKRAEIIAARRAEEERKRAERIAQQEAEEKKRVEELRLDKLRNPEKYAKIERERKLEEQRRIEAARRYEEEWRKERDASKFKSEQDVISYLNGGDFISTVFKIKIRLDSYGNRMFVYVGGKKSYTVDRISIYKDGRASVFLREHPYGDIVAILVDKFNDILQYQGVNHSKVN